MSFSSSGYEFDPDIGGAADIAAARRQLSSRDYLFGTGRASDLFDMADRHEPESEPARALTGIWGQAVRLLEKFARSMEAASIRGQAFGMSRLGDVVVLGELVEPPPPSHDVQELANQIGIERYNRAMGHGELYGPEQS